MGLLNRFLKKATPNNNEQLIPSLTKSIVKSACKLRDGDWDDFKEVENTLLIRNDGKIYFLEHLVNT